MAPSPPIVRENGRGVNSFLGAFPGDTGSRSEFPRTHTKERNGPKQEKFSVVADPIGIREFTLNHVYKPRYLLDLRRLSEFPGVREFSGTQTFPLAEFPEFRLNSLAILELRDLSTCTPKRACRSPRPVHTYNLRRSANPAGCRVFALASTCACVWLSL